MLFHLAPLSIKLISTVPMAASYYMAPFNKSANLALKSLLLLITKLPPHNPSWYVLLSSTISFLTYANLFFKSLICYYYFCPFLIQIPEIQLQFLFPLFC